MISVGVLCCLFSAISATPNSSDAAPSNERTIEILIAGPEDARNRMDRAIRPLLGTDPDVRWAVEEQLPTERALPEMGQQGAAQIWIDVSNPMRMRVYLPAAETKGATNIRTLTRAGAEGEASDLLAREAVAQIVKAAVFTLRRGPAEPADDVTTPALESSAEAASQQPAARRKRSDGLLQGASMHDGLFLRIFAGYGKVTASESSGYGTDSYEKLGPTISTAVGGTIAHNLILYGEFLMTGLANASETGGSSSGRDFVVYSFGPGVAYYFEPINLYVSGTLALAKLDFIDRYPDTDMGYAGSFTVGKEWWVSRDWGLGIAGQFNMASMKHYQVSYEVSEAQMHVTTLSVLFSATYN
jgi:hypothetical protein